MRVFMTGLIYLNGCKAEIKRAYAPNGSDYQPPHHASLWVPAGQVDTSATTWADSVEHPRLAMVEFKIREHSQIVFPDQGVELYCDDLETKLPKLKKKKKDGSEHVFDVEDSAGAIAEVTIRGGRIEPKRF